MVDDATRHLEGRLAALEYAHGIDRQPLVAMLQEAVERQEEFRENVSAAAAEFDEWRARLKNIPYRRKQVDDAIEVLLTQLTESAFDELIQDRWRDRLRYFRFYLDRFLAQKLELAQQMVEGLDGSTRAPGRPGDKWVNECLADIAEALRSGHVKMTKAEVYEYTGKLAQSCGALPLDLTDASAVVRRRVSYQSTTSPKAEPQQRPPAQNSPQRWTAPPIANVPDEGQSEWELRTMGLIRMLDGHWTRKIRLDASADHLESEELNEALYRLEKRLIDTLPPSA